MRGSVLACLCALIAAGASDTVMTQYLFEMTCKGGVLDRSTRMRQEHLTRFATVVLHGCAPPAGVSYAAALRALNVIVGHTLELTETPALPPGALDSLPSFRTLKLSNPRLRVKRQLEGQQTRHGMGGELIGIELNSVMDHELSPGFLRGATDLTTFVAVNNSFITVPQDLFAYSPNMNLIDLSDNLLETLPSGLFSGIVSLTSLILTNNRLTVSVLDVIAPVTTLTDLRLNLNPIGDHCQPGVDTSVLSGLTDLKILDLSYTNATRVCGDMLSHMRMLQELHLSYNNIDVIWCQQLSVGHAFFVENATIEMEGNSLTQIGCSWEDYYCPLDSPGPIKPAQLLVSRPATCDCSMHWLIKAMSERLVEVVFHPLSKLDRCRREWLECDD